MCSREKCLVPKTAWKEETCGPGLCGTGQESSTVREESGLSGTPDLTRVNSSWWKELSWERLALEVQCKGLVC